MGEKARPHPHSRGRGRTVRGQRATIVLPTPVKTRKCTVSFKVTLNPYSDDVASACKAWGALPQPRALSPGLVLVPPPPGSSFE